MKLTKAEIDVVAKLAERGEALKQGPYFVAGGFTLCDASLMARMARKGAVRLETIGQSVFANLDPSVDPPSPG